MTPDAANALKNPPEPTRMFPGATGPEAGIEDSAAFPFLLAFLLCALLLALKAPDSLLRPQFWAEDGVIFYAGQYQKGLPQLFSPYAGYMHLIPRLTAWIASTLPATAVPFAYGVLTLFVGAASLASLRGFARLGLGFLLALAPVALAPTSGEQWGSITYVQWITQFYVVAMMIRLFVGGPGLPAPWNIVVAALVGLTGPFSLFGIAAVVPVWICLRLRGGVDAMRAALRRIPAEWIVLAICAFVQMVTLMSADHLQVATGHLDARQVRLFLTALQVHTLGAAVMPTSLFVILVVAMLWASLRRRDLACKAFLSALTLFVGVQLLAALYKIAGEIEVLLPLANGDRYFFPFKVYFWWLVTLTVMNAVPRVRQLPAVVLTATLGVEAVCFHDALTRPPLPDLHWNEYARRIDAGEAVDVPINPVPWQFHVPARH